MSVLVLKDINIPNFLLNIINNDSASELAIESAAFSKWEFTRWIRSAAIRIFSESFLLFYYFIIHSLLKSLLVLQVATQISLVLLLFGTMIGDFALLGDTGTPSALHICECIN